MARARFRMFGNFAYLCGDGRPGKISLSKGIGLLAIVALSKSRSCTRNKIMNLLWSDRNEEQARSSLRHSLWSVKHDLIEFSDKLLQVDRRSVGISPALCSIDVVDFLELSQSGNRRDLEKSIAIYAGDLLDDLVIHDPAWQEWIRQQNQHLRLTYAENLFTLSEHYLSEKNVEFLIRTGRQLVEHNNLCERGHCALMKGYYLGQQKSLALKQFDQYRSTIMRELDSFPDRNIRALYEEIKDDRVLF